MCAFLLKVHNSRATQYYVLKICMDVGEVLREFCQIFGVKAQLVINFSSDN